MKLSALLIAFALTLSVGCSSKPAASDAPPAAPSANTKRYAMHGKVVSVNAEDKSAKINADEIKGWMSAMTMDYPVRDTAEMAKLAADKTIDATVFVDGDNFWIGEVKDSAPVPAAAADQKK